MSGVALKITTLLIRTVSKPIANRIKAQAREHEGFRRVCVGWAQLIHRVDMRLRLGLLQDPAALERQAQREAAEAAKRKRLAEAPTVRTEAQMKADEEEARREAKDGVKKLKEKEGRAKIKPLSEAKAIDLGSNFIAESFLFAVAVGTVLFETYRSRKKEKTRRDDVADQLAELRELDLRKSRKIEDLEREVKVLKSHEWHWPWQRHNESSDEEKEVGAGSKVLAQVAEKERERELKKLDGDDQEMGDSGSLPHPTARAPRTTHEPSVSGPAPRTSDPVSVSGPAPRDSAQSAASTESANIDHPQAADEKQ